MLLDLFIIMKDIFKFFKGSSKKRDLSDTWKTGEDPKKMRETSGAKFVAENDDFNEGNTLEEIV